jgi:hypothetical protein
VKRDKKFKREGLKQPPFETKDLRDNLAKFFDTPIFDSIECVEKKVGNFRWGVYAFFDYDDEPIYVGETNESLRTRIRRHLTNQRTDAVAMAVLDPFEVHRIEVWPLPQFEHVIGDRHPDRPSAIAYLKSLEEAVYRQLVARSSFGAILNEKIPKPKKQVAVTLPRSYEAVVVSPQVYEIRSHPDARIARRASTIARLAQVISERQVQIGLRNVLAVQARRLEALATRRYGALGGAKTLEAEALAQPDDKTESEVERDEGEEQNSSS